MKNINLLAMLSLLAILWSCGDDDDAKPAEFGTFQVYFDNKVGADDITRRDNGSTEYDFETSTGEKFNLSLLGYYVSKITLEGPNGEYFQDEMKASASEAKGYYHVLEGESASQNIKLEQVPAGTYNKITFAIGVEEDGVLEGAAGGVLDPADGAWFWNWNAGYIGFALEGTAENSGQEYVDWGGGRETLENTFAIHIGGWKDVADNENFINNIKTITLDFGTTVKVGPDLSPLAHLVTDAMKVLDGAAIDFSNTFSVHAPKAGKPFAEQLPQVFSVHHVHQSTSGHD
ncbi:hypothetical protein QQ020_13850 [Fulvivirgaceae bacterium BMA12]|uniref:Copper-binding protein MbnP-like domain-containing protein n=1 Tax=Agaribacillus aureus TaxID=3051825 RepID=A0ABT8L7W2_9BACT|nr:hypothetical protein [Fulvivirgaceae bacterium BMA12]